MDLDRAPREVSEGSVGCKADAVATFWSQVRFSTVSSTHGTLNGMSSTVIFILKATLVEKGGKIALETSMSTLAYTPRCSVGSVTMSTISPADFDLALVVWRQEAVGFLDKVSVELECLGVELARQRWAASLVAAAAAGSAQAVSELLVAPPPGPAEGLLDVDANLPPSGQFPNVTAAYAAALHGHADVLKLLLEAGADPNIKGVKSSQWDGAFTLTEADTALVVACKEGHLDCVEGLLASGADPNVDCSSEYFEGAVEWGDEDDGTEQFFYTALDVTDRASVGSDKDPEHWRQLRALLVSHGARHTTQLQLAKRQGVRVKVTSGSRMGA
ncbi:unnamed protein product [Prorocentrum cordatum]|uniref:Uncharacterized protein n=1 Tax=Prorocentrum cordatum TaxID=2364126 RepID=A0ABN9TMF4_9DINO|nr:unnamed protein product [Polarella glacialis]